MNTTEIHAINAKLRALKSTFFDGDALNRLLSARSAEEVAIHIFPEIVISEVAVNVVTEFEIKLYNNSIQTFKKILKFSNSMRPLLLILIRRFEIANLKKIVKAVIFPRFKGEVRFLDISPYASFDPREAIRCNNLNELSDFLSSTHYKNIILPNMAEMKNPAFVIENNLDKMYYSDLFDLCDNLPAHHSRVLEKFLKEETRFINLLWILRLKRYYDIDVKELKNWVIHHKKCPFNTTVYTSLFELKYEDEIISNIPSDLLRIIEKVYLESHGMLPDYDKITLAEIEITINKVLKKIYSRYFYQKYLSVTPILSFFGLKLIEITNLNSIVEGFRFNLNREDIRKMII